MYARRITGLIFLAISVVVSASEIVCGQKSRSVISKSTALKQARVSALPGWRETISNDGRFRILFPGKPHAVDDRDAYIKGFKFETAENGWVAQYSNLERAIPNDDLTLRAMYRPSEEAIALKGQQLLARRDVFLNGRLGRELVILGTGRVTYMRAFVFGRRVYTLSVDRWTVKEVSAAIPTDVQQFFDSFAYWD
jgi:hypothetical protein